MKRSIPLIIFTLAVCGRCRIGEYHRFHIPALDKKVDCAFYSSEGPTLDGCKDGKKYLGVQNVADEGPTGECL